MRLVIFTHSLVSDWNHGNAHFLRGVTSELTRRGHDVHVLEPAGGWSRENLLADAGETAIAEFHRAYPLIGSTLYDEESLDLDTQLRRADVVLVHEWNSHRLVRSVGDHHSRNPDYTLLFHDTHHRAITDESSMAAYDWSQYDGVLAYGEVLRERYIRKGWARQAWTWHEAADTAVFHPLDTGEQKGDLVWIGNWGDAERTEELREFLIEPVKKLKLKAKVYGVRYPGEALDELRAAGIEYGGWLPNYKVPEVFAQYRMTVHVPRRPYANVLPGIPTIRPFEAMACGIPMISAPWSDVEGLFRPGDDFLTAANGAEMTCQMERVLHDPDLSDRVAASGLSTILRRHTCAHRVDELERIVRTCEKPALMEEAS